MLLGGAMWWHGSMSIVEVMEVGGISIDEAVWMGGVAINEAATLLRGMAIGTVMGLDGMAIDERRSNSVAVSRLEWREGVVVGGHS